MPMKGIFEHLWYNSLGGFYRHGYPADAGLTVGPEI